MMRMMHLNGYAPPQYTGFRSLLVRDRPLTLIDLAEENNTGESSGEASAMLISSSQVENPRIGIIWDGWMEQKDP